MMGIIQFKLFSIATFTFNAINAVLSYQAIFIDVQSNFNIRFFEEGKKDIDIYCLYSFNVSNIVCDRVWQNKVVIHVIFYAIRFDVAFSTILFFIGFYNTIRAFRVFNTSKVIHFFFLLKTIVLFGLLLRIFADKSRIFEDLLFKSTYVASKTASRDVLTYYGAKFEAIVLPILSFIVTITGWLIIMIIQFNSFPALSPYFMTPSMGSFSDVRVSEDGEEDEGIEMKYIAPSTSEEDIAV